MPCNTIRVTQIEFGKATDPGLLMAALTELGLSPQQRDKTIYFRLGQFDTQTGQLSVRRNDATEFASELKQCYSAQIVKTQAKKFGWQLKETAKYQYEIQRR